MQSKAAEPSDQILVISYLLSVIGNRLSGIGYQLSVISYQGSVIRDRLSVIGYQLSGIGYQLSEIGYQRSVISMEKEFGFEKLLVYQKSKEYVRTIYSLLKQFPAEERYAMCDQLRRASVSVTSNIAEGTSRGTVKEKIHFLDIAFGSLMETYSQMDIAKDLQYINEEELMQVREQCLVVLKLLAGLKKSYDSAQEKQIADN